MKARDLGNKTSKLVTDNSPAILTAIGVSGLVATAYLTGKASFKAADILSKETEYRNRDALYEGQNADVFTKKEQIGYVWREYIPAIVVGSLSVAAVIGSNRIGTRRTAAMTAAMTLSERAYSEYKEKVVETIGKTKETKVRDEIAQDRVKANPASNQAVIVAGSGDVLFMDALSGRYFTSNMEAVKAAQNSLNHEVLNQGYASLTDLYSRLGLSNNKMSDDVGWNSDKLLEITYSTTISDDGRPCMVVDFIVAPVRNFFRAH